MEKSSHCRDLDGRGKERKGEGSEPRPAPTQGCILGLGLVKPSACSGFLGRHSFQEGTLARPEKAQFLWFTTFSGD